MVKARNINKSYGSVKTLKDVNLDIAHSENVVLWGPSGSGKTTLFNIICGLQKNFSGSIINSADKTSCCFQEERLIENLSAEKNISIVREIQDIKYLADVIEIFGLTELKDQKVYQLSGGERQRVAIARALYYDADFIMLDEAFKSLDSVLKFSILKRLNNLDSFRKSSVLFITHDIIEAYMTADRIISITKSPAVIDRIIEIKKPLSERKITDAEINEYYNELVL